VQAAKQALLDQLRYGESFADNMTDGMVDGLDNDLYSSNGASASTKSIHELGMRSIPAFEPANSPYRNRTAVQFSQDHAGNVDLAARRSMSMGLIARVKNSASRAVHKEGACGYRGANVERSDTGGDMRRSS